MNPGLILIVVSGFWVASEIVIAIRRRSSITGASSRDRLSIHAMWVAFAGGPFAGGMLTAVRAARMPPPIRPYAFWGGLALIFVGIAARWTAIGTLKKYFTVDVAIAPDHKVIQHGLYRFVRHPSYSGSLLSSTGLGLAFGNWLSLAAVVLFALAGVAYRVSVEERALIDALGDEYRAYAARTKRLIPGIY
ncbi:MAG TPA: isoprenylcysteine carboxylmethyltransferase family protein [Thermoanaerobaculia bacterium]|nr:isoprenylcysteine carboxylmethyltransferase family protein [Thermoanaerobaculia bacterium]